MKILIIIFSENIGINFWSQLHLLAKTLMNHGMYFDETLKGNHWMCIHNW